MENYKYIKSCYGYRCPCIYMVSIVPKNKFNYEIAVFATDSDGKVLDEKPIYSKKVKGWLRARIEYRRVYKEYDRKINGKDSILLW